MTDEKRVTTTNSGAPVASDEHSQSVGADGAIALHDHYLVEKLAQFNREEDWAIRPRAPIGSNAGRGGGLADVLLFRRGPMDF